jgi:hypothetical protein
MNHTFASLHSRLVYVSITLVVLCFGVLAISDSTSTIASRARAVVPSQQDLPVDYYSFASLSRGSLAGQADTPAAQQTTVTLLAMADATLIGLQATTNFSNSPTLQVMLGPNPNNNAVTLVRFELSSLPTYAIIDSAYFQLYLESGSGLDPVCLAPKRVTSTWDESTVTWNTAPTTFHPVFDLCWTTDLTPGYKSFNIDGWVTYWRSNSSYNYGVMLLGPLSGTDYYSRVYSSRERGSNPPKLVITYHLPTSYLPLVMRNYPLPTPTPTPLCDPYEPNDDRYHPWGPLQSNHAYEAKLCTGDPEDNYYFDTVTENPVQIHLQLPSSLVNHTLIWLYSQTNLTQTICGAGPVTTENYSVSCSISQSGRYIVRLYTTPGVSDNIYAYTLTVTYQ